MKHSSSVPVVAGPRRHPSPSLRTSPSLLGPGLTLDHPCLVPSARPGPSAASGQRARQPLAPGQLRAPRSAAGRPAGWACWPWAAAPGGSSTARRGRRPAEVSTPMSPRGRPHGGTHHVVVEAATAAAHRLGGRGPGEQPGRGQQREARVVGDLQRNGVAAATAVLLADSSRTVRRGVLNVLATSASSVETTFLSRRPRRDRVELLDGPAQLLPPFSSSSRGEPVSRRSCISRM